MRRLFVALAGIGTVLVGVGWFSSAHAGSGYGASCSNGYAENPGGYREVPLITQPITLALEVPDPTAPTPGDQVRLCYSTSRSGWDGPDTTGGAITVAPLRPNVWCNPQSNIGNFLPFWCYADGNGTASAGNSDLLVQAQRPQWQTGESTIAASIPIRVCNHETCQCIEGACGVGTTGVILALIDLDRMFDGNDGNPYYFDGIVATGQAPAGTTGVGIRGVLLWFCADGNCLPLSAPLDLATGIGLTASARGPVCPDPNICVPQGASAIVGPPIAVVQVGDQTIPVEPLAGLYSTSACVDTVNYGSFLAGRLLTNGSFSTDTCSYGGCSSSSLVVVAVGEAGCGYEANGFVAAGLLGADARDECRSLFPLWFCWVGVAVSETGDAATDSPFGVAATGTGNAHGLWAGTVVSGTGTASNGHVVISPLGNAQGGALANVSGTGTSYNSSGCSDGYGWLSASGTGDAHGSWHTVSGTGNAYGTNEECWSGNGDKAVSGTGDASSGTAVAGRNATGHGGGVAAVGLTGNAAANGALVAASGTGDAQGGYVASVDANGVDCNWPCSP